MEKKKLTLNKSVISKLTIEQQSKVMGGNAEFGSSRKNCIGFLCCDGPAASAFTHPDPACNPQHTSPQDTCTPV